MGKCAWCGSETGRVMGLYCSNKCRQEAKGSKGKGGGGFFKKLLTAVIVLFVLVAICQQGNKHHQTPNSESSQTQGK